MQTDMATHNTDQEQGNTMNSNPNHGSGRKEKQMNAITKATSIAVLITLGLALSPCARAADALPVKADKHATITVRVNDTTAGAGMNQVEYVGKWTHGSDADQNGCLGGDCSWSNTAGDTMRIRFFGTRVRLYGKRAAHHGTGMVSVDDNEESEAVFRAAGNEYKALVYESPVLPAGLHTLRLRVTDAYSVPDYVEIDTPRGEPATIEILGGDSVLVPKAGSISVRYSSRVLNAHGYGIPGEAATWSLQSPVKGVSLDAKAGLVTVNNTAEVRGAFILVATAGAVQVSKTVALPAPKLTHTLVTEDTSLTLCVAGNQMYITSLKNPQQEWDWAQEDSSAPVPLPSKVSGQAVQWEYAGHSLDTTNGNRLVLSFTSASPKMELTSVWRARPGVGPVEHQISVVNRSDGPIVFLGDDVEAANLNLVADKAVQFFPLDAAVVGPGEGTPLPYQIVKVGAVHGIYFAYDYSCGQYKATRDAANPLRVNCRFWVGNKVSTKIAAGDAYHLPGIMIQTYQGDEDDAANHFRKWFWNYEITPSLKRNPNEPRIEICNPPGPDGDPDFLVNQAKTVDFAGWGVGCLKTDWWHWNRGHARSDEIAGALHAKGIKLSMYFNGAAMVAKPDDQAALNILLNEAKKSRFDYYRSDIYNGPHYVNMRDYHSVESFKRRLETLAKAGVGWENCANGGNVRSLDVCRRMTFMTHSDHSGLVPFFVHVYHWSYLMPPIQIKNDYWVCEGNREEGTVSVAWLRGNLLGAILTGPPSSRSFQGALDQIKKVFHLYNTKQRPILRGADVYRILPPPAKNQWFGIQYYNTFINKGSVLLWQNGGPASQVVKLKGLDRNKTYSVTFEDAKHKSGQMTGAQLMDRGLDVPMGPNASEIIWLDSSK